MMKKVTLLMFLMLPLGMFCACSSNDEPTQTLLYNQWVLVSYGNESNEVLKETKGYYYLITFHSDGTFSGEAYGNDIGGKFKCNGKDIQIAIGSMSMVYFVGADPDQFFLEHLSDVYTYTINDTELRLYYSKNHYFKFRINDQL